MKWLLKLIESEEDNLCGEFCTPSGLMLATYCTQYLHATPFMRSRMLLEALSGEACKCMCMCPHIVKSV